MPRLTPDPLYADDYLDLLQAHLVQGKGLRMVRLWINQDGSRTDVKVYVATTRGEVADVTTHVAYAMNEHLYPREPAGFALRLSSGGVNPSLAIIAALEARFALEVQVHE